MLNEITEKNFKIKNPFLIHNTLSVKEIFTSVIIAEIEKFKNNEIDNLIIHGLPIPTDLPFTPQEIKSAPKNIFLGHIIKSIGNFLGTLSKKNLENTVRFRNTHDGTVNEEPWHGHSQYKYSIFYCLRADSEAKTYFFSVHETIKNAQPEIIDALLTPHSYISNKNPFPLISKGNHGYELSLQVYGRSDFEKHIEDLDLPDVIKTLKEIGANNLHNKKAHNTITYLLSAILNTTSYIVYKPGDIALYNETSTMRFSPAYTPSTIPEEDRWMLSVSIEK